MRTITKFRRSTRGLSPIFATLILIAIAVIAGIVVYMFTSGMLADLTGGGGTAQEKMAIQAVAGETDGVVGDDVITIYAQSTGGGAIPLDSAILKHSQQNVVYVYADTNMDIATVATTLTTIEMTFSGQGNMVVGESYTITLVTVAGGNFPSTSFKATLAP